MSKKRKCDCNLHEHQVCDICQGVKNLSTPRLMEECIHNYKHELDENGICTICCTGKKPSEPKDKPVEKCSCGVDSCDGKPPLRDLLKEKYDKPSEGLDYVVMSSKLHERASKDKSLRVGDDIGGIELTTEIKKWVEGRLPKKISCDCGCQDKYKCDPTGIYNQALADVRKALLGEE